MKIKWEIINYDDCLFKGEIGGRAEDHGGQKCEEESGGGKRSIETPLHPCRLWKRPSSVCLRARVHPCPIVFHEVSVCVPRGSDNSIATHNTEEQGTLEASISSCLVPTMSPRGYSGRPQRNDEDSLRQQSSLFSVRSPRLSRELGSSVRHPLTLVPVDILTLIGRQRPPCNFIKGASCPWWV